MAIPYRPRVISNERGTYLITCKKELAQELTEFLNHEGILATLTDAETTENLEFNEESESYTVCQIGLAGSIDPGRAKNAIDAWCQSRR